MNNERKIISTDLLNKINEKFISEKSVKQRFETLSSEQKKICAFSYLFGKKGLKTDIFKSEDRDLLVSFLLYSASNKECTKYYFGFDKMEEVIYEDIALILFNIIKTDLTGVTAPSFLRMRCLNDFVIILICALSGLLKKRNDGKLTHGSLVHLGELLHSTTESTSINNKTQDNKNVIQLLIEFGIERNIINENEKNFITTHSQINNWLSIPIKERYDDFVSFTCQYSIGWSMKIFKRMVEIDRDAWFSTSHFPQSDSDELSTALQLIHYIGFIDLFKNDKDLFFKYCNSIMETDATDSTQKITILPDFSAILPLEVLPESIFFFSHLGIISNLDIVYKGSINRESVNESLTNGIEMDTLLVLLDQWQSPENVTETVKEWIREFSRVCMIHDPTVVAFDSNTALQLNEYPMIKDLLEPLKADTVFTIKKGFEKQVRKILLSMGFDPRIPAVQSPPEDSFEEFLFKNQNDEFRLCLDFDHPNQKVSRPLTSGKYSDELKELEVNEIFHVIDYAILMGEKLEFEYMGCEKVNKGRYIVTPSKFNTEGEAKLEGLINNLEESSIFLIKNIKMIGVKSI
jgi:hypothetical protein